MKLGLDGRRAIVTGGSRGTGRAIAEALAEEGVDIATCAHGEEDLQRAVKELEQLGVRAQGWALDVSEAGSTSISEPTPADSESSIEGEEEAMPTTASPDAPTVTPAPIIRTVTGVMAAQHLMVANEVELFEQLGDDALTAEVLAERTALPFRSARILADALVACGLLEKDDGRYRNSPETAAFLSGRGPADLRPYVRMAHKVGYPGWDEFDEAIRAGGGTQAEVFHTSDETQRIMSDGIAAMTALGAAALAGSFDFAGFDRLLDVAGGSGIHLQTILARNPGLSGTLVELPPVAAQARQRLQPLIDAGRAEVVDGDVFEDPLPGGHDLVLLSHTLHLFTPEPNRQLLRRIRDGVDSGTRLLLVDFWTNADHTEPAAVALAAGEFYRLTGGDVYSVEEAQEWLAQTGWRFRGHQPLAGPESLIQAEAA